MSHPRIYFVLLVFALLGLVFNHLVYGWVRRRREARWWKKHRDSILMRKTKDQPSTAGAILHVNEEDKHVIVQTDDEIIIIM